MKKMMMHLLVGLAVVAVQAGDIMISWTSNGVLQATGMEPGTSCTLEWTSNLQNGFVTNEAPFSGLVADSNGMLQVVIPMFFRVSGTPLGAGPPAGMVVIPAGTNSGTDPEWGDAYSLTLTNAFYMDATEVTKAQWDTVYNWAIVNGYSFDFSGTGKASDHPVHFLNWYDIVKWCNARSEMGERTPCYTVSGNTYKTGSFGSDGSDGVDCDFNMNGYRLPTSDEWEYAARGGVSSQRFPWGDTITHSQANYYASDLYTYDISPTINFHPSYEIGNQPYTSPVGDFPANGYGLYDMSGNLVEWCWDLKGARRVTRGAGWAIHAEYARVGNEHSLSPDFVDNFVGFRAACR